jgi:hypothetical protein
VRRSSRVLIALAGGLPWSATISAVPSFPRPYASLTSGRATLRFYLGDCVDWLGRFEARSLDVIVTSPPYNLGIRYRSYDDTLPRDEYLAWTNRWIGAAAQALGPSGWGQADRSLGRARCRPGRPGPPPAAEHVALDQVDCAQS